jgi:hypothetical protein
MAGGIPAGRLSIEIVAEIARLQADLDKAKRAVNAASADISRSARAANDNLAGVGRGASVMGRASSKSSRTLTQLSFQLNDVATMAASGSGAFQIFATQAGQIVQVMQQAEGGVKGFAAELGGFLLRIGPLAVVLGTAGAAFGLFQRAMTEGTDPDELTKNLGLTKAEIKRLEGVGISTGDVLKATFQVLAEQAGISFDGMGKAWSGALDWMTDVARKAMANIYANTVGTFKAVWAAVVALRDGKGLGGAWGAATEAYTSARNDADQYLKDTGRAIRERALRNEREDLARQAAAIKADRTPKRDRRGESLAREIEATEALIDGLYRSAEAYRVSTAAGIRAKVEAEAIAKGIRKQADLHTYAAQQLRKYVAEQVNGSAEQVAAMNEQTRAYESVNRAIRNGTLDADKASEALSDMAEQQKLMTAMSVAQLNGDVKGYEAAKKALKDLTDAQLANKKARTETADRQQAAQIDRSIEDIRLETQLTRDLGEARLKAMRGLSGTALDDKLARIAMDHAKIAIQMQAEVDAARELKLGHTEVAAAIMRKAEADKTQVDVSYDIERQEVALGRYNDELRDTIYLLGSLGKVGEGLGALLGILTGNTRGVRGPIGDLLNVGMTGKNAEGKEFASTIGDEISKIFDKDGKFVKAVAPMLRNAATGMAAGSLLFGRQSATEQAGSALGGALGGKLGEKALSKGLESIAKGLGDFAGPLGSIVGGVLGNVLGGVFGKVKWGRVDLTSAGVSDTSGNSKSSQKAALAAGNSIYGGLADLARQFGGTLGDFGRISVGVRHGDYRVNTGGTSLKVKKGAVDFNEDAEAAVAYAMKMAIERGAINGIRQSTNNLLKAGDDLSAQINKALSFENVFSELKSYLDPVGYELENLEKEFKQLRTIFAEAGATAEEYAQLEQLLTIKRQEALNKEQDALNDIRSRIAEVQGDDATVKAIARARELREATSDAQRAELERLYALEDAAEAQSAAALAAEELRQAWESVGSSIMDEVNRIRGLAGGDDAASFAVLQGRFNAAVAAARSGDQEAAARLVDLSQSLLEAAGNAATSRQELERIKAQTAASLEGVHGLIDTLGSGSASASAASASSAAAAGSGNAGSSSADSAAAAEIRSLREELAKLRSEMNSGNATIASNTGRIARKLDDVTSASGGEAITVASAA